MSPPVACGRALVVGASAGIGRAVAVRLTGGGWAVAAVGRRRDRLDELASAGGTVTPIVADLMDAVQCRALVDAAAGALGEIDLVVFCAGTSRLGLVRDATADDWSSTFATNVIAPALVIAAALPYLAGGAVVAVLSSETVGAPYPGLVPYGASKAAVEELVRGLRIEHPEVRFCCLRVGATDGTELARDFSPELGAELFPQWIALGRMPARMMQVDELGGAIADMLAVAVAAPGLDLQDMVVRAPGGPYLGDAGFMIDNVEEAARQRG